MKVLLFSVLLSICFLNGRCQEKLFYGGYFPELALTQSLAKNTSITFKVESQHIQYDNRELGSNLWKYAHYRTDLQGFISSKLSPYWKISIGYQYRIEGSGPDHHRAVQQLAYVQNSPGVRFGHRLRSDQTFSAGIESTEYRLRYRFSSEIPLIGQTLEPKEIYLLASNEIISGIKAGQSELENRLVGSLGYYFGMKAKVEAGIDWRIDKIISKGLRNRLWLKFGCFLNL